MAQMRSVAPVKEKVKFGIPLRPLYHPARVRQWAKDQGYIVPINGRLPAHLIRLYLKEKSITENAHVSLAESRG